MWSDALRDALWKTRYDELWQFKNVYGHCLIPQKYHEDVTLGNWVNQQRRSYKLFLAGGAGEEGDGVGGGGLTREKIDCLEKIGFCWTERDYRWFGMLERLKVLVEERRLEWMNSENEEDNDGDGDDKDDEDDENGKKYRPEWFTISHDDHPNRDLRIWIIVQRREYVNYQYNLNLPPTATTTQTPKKYCAITPTRISSLDALHFPWKSTDAHDRSKNKENGGTNGPTVDDWSLLFRKMKEKGRPRPRLIGSRDKV